MRIKKDHKNMLMGALVAIVAVAFLPAQYNPVNYLKDILGGRS